MEGRDSIQVDDSAVVFRTPWPQRLWGWVSIAVATLVVGLLMPAGIWAGVGFSAWKTPPLWWHGVGLALSVGGVLLVIWGSGAMLTRQLALREDGWRLDRLRRGRLASYEQVALLRLESDKGSIGVGGLRKLQIDLRSGGRRYIWLRKADAAEALDAMHGLCMRAGAIAPDRDAIMPVDEEAHAEAQAAFARHYRRKFWLCVAGIVALSAWCVFVASMLVGGGSKASQSPRHWRWLIYGLIALVSLIISAVRLRRTSRSFDVPTRPPRSQADHGSQRGPEWPGPHGEFMP